MAQQYHGFPNAAIPDWAKPHLDPHAHAAAQEASRQRVAAQWAEKGWNESFRKRFPTGHERWEDIHRHAAAKDAAAAAEWAMRSTKQKAARELSQRAARSVPRTQGARVEKARRVVTRSRATSRRGRSGFVNRMDVD